MSKKLDEVWEWCDKEQRKYAEWDEDLKGDFIQGKIIALREIQFLIKGICSHIVE